MLLNDDGDMTRYDQLPPKLTGSGRGVIEFIRVMQTFKKYNHEYRNKNERAGKRKI
jgi:hypothetical protein